MRPTPEADLRRVRLSVERLVAEEALAPAAAAGLEGVIRSLRRLERALPRILPHLAAENESTARVLAELAPLMPEELAAEVAALEPSLPAVDALPMFDPAVVGELNTTLRDLLSRAIAVLPAGEAGAAARALIRDHLERTLALRPW